MQRSHYILYIEQPTRALQAHRLMDILIDMFKTKCTIFLKGVGGGGN